MNTYSDENRHPCGAVHEGDWIVIAIHKNTLKNAIELNQGLEYYSDEQEDYMPPKIINLDQFVNDVVDALNREEEDGSTLITKALDDAVVEACESGSDAIQLGWD